MSPDDVGELKALFESRFDSLMQQIEEVMVLFGGRLEHLEKETDRRFRGAFAACAPIERDGSHAGLPSD